MRQDLLSTFAVLCRPGDTSGKLASALRGPIKLGVHAQAKADASRQAAEEAAAENAQLGAHVHLLESELEAAQAQATHGAHPVGSESAEASPRDRHSAQAGSEEHGAAAAAAAGAVHQSPPEQAGLRRQSSQLRSSACPCDDALFG